MKVQSWYDVCCDKCGRHLCDFGSGMQDNKQEVISIAKEKGWKHRKEENETICPICIEEGK